MNSAIRPSREIGEHLLRLSSTCELLFIERSIHSRVYLITGVHSVFRTCRIKRAINRRKYARRSKAPTCVKSIKAGDTATCRGSDLPPHAIQAWIFASETSLGYQYAWIVLKLPRSTVIFESDSIANIRYAAVFHFPSLLVSKVELFLLSVSDRQRRLGDNKDDARAQISQTLEQKNYHGKAFSHKWRDGPPARFLQSFSISIDARKTGEHINKTNSLIQSDVNEKFLEWSSLMTA